MDWSKEQLEDHKRAAELLDQIKDQAFGYISSNQHSNEYEIQQFILEKFKKNNLRSGVGPPIVGFDESAAEPHYFPPRKGSRKLPAETLVLIDIWARLNKPGAPYADITWVAYKGRKVPSRTQKAFDTVINARDTALHFLESELNKGSTPTGKAVDQVGMEVLENAGYKKHIKHRTGHTLGVGNVHGHKGKHSLSIRNEGPMLLGVGYTIEPGVYIDGEFGIRSEIDIFISKEKRVLLTTKKQEEITSL